jgi:hypothetical protein
MCLGIYLLATRAQRIADRVRAGQSPWET